MWSTCGTVAPAVRRLVVAVGAAASVWNLSPISRRPLLLEHPGGSVSDALFSPDGKRIATASSDNTAVIWDAATGTSLVTLRGHAASVDRLAWSPDGTMLATASDDATVQLWDSVSGRRLARRLGHAGGVRDVAFHPQGLSIVSASVDRSAIVWSVEPSQLQRPLPARQMSMQSAQFSPSGAHVATAGDDGTVTVSDAMTGTPLLTLAHGSPVAVVRFSPDGRWIATAARDRLVRVWDPSKRAPAQELAGHRGEIRSLEWDPAGERLVSAGEGGEVRIWTPGRDDGQAIAPHGDAPVTWAAFVGPKSIISLGGDGTAVLTDLATGRAVRSFRDPDRRTKGALDRRRQRVASPTASRTVEIWRLDTGATEVELVGHVGNVVQVAWSPDDRFVVTASYDATARIWDAATGDLLGVFLHPENSWVLDAAFSPDGSRIVTTEGDGQASIWELPRFAGDARQLATLVRCRVPYRVDGERLALSARDPVACSLLGQNR